jgi:hypothetical protein
LWRSRRRQIWVEHKAEVAVAEQVVETAAVEAGGQGVWEDPKLLGQLATASALVAGTG